MVICPTLFPLTEISSKSSSLLEGSMRIRSSCLFCRKKEVFHFENQKLVMLHLPMRPRQVYRTFVWKHQLKQDQPLLRLQLRLSHHLLEWSQIHQSGTLDTNAEKKPEMLSTKIWFFELQNSWKIILAPNFLQFFYESKSGHFAHCAVSKNEKFRRIWATCG